MPQSHGNMKHATTTLGSTSSTVTSNGMNVHHADTSVQSRFGTTTAHGELAQPTNPVWQEEGTTMVLVTHEIGFAREVATRVMFMDEGYFVEENAPGEFFANPKNERLKNFLSKVL